METTLRAIKKVNEIKAKRADMFFKMRMKAHEVTQREIIRAEIKKGIELIAPAASNQERVLENVFRNAIEKNTVLEDKMET